MKKIINSISKLLKYDYYNQLLRRKNVTVDNYFLSDRLYEGVLIEYSKTVGSKSFKSLTEKDKLKTIEKILFDFYSQEKRKELIKTYPDLNIEKEHPLLWNSNYHSIYHHL